MTETDHAMTARRLYTALANSDGSEIDAVLHPEFVANIAEGMPRGLGGTYRGSAQMKRDFYRRVGEQFDVHAEGENFHALEDGGLLVRGRYRGNHRASGNALNAEFTHVMRFDSDGRIVSLDQLTDTALWAQSLAIDEQPQNIQHSISDRGVAVICLNRPEQRNAIDAQTVEEFLRVCRAIAADRSVRYVLNCGNGSSLSVGGDLGEFSALGPELIATDLVRLARRSRSAAAALRD